MDQFKLILLLLFVGLSLPRLAIGQISHGGIPRGYTKSSSSEISFVTMPYVNNAEKSASNARVSADKSGPFIFGESTEVNLNLNNSGRWKTLSNGERIWNFGIRSDGAYTLNLIFSEYNLPEGATVFIYNEDKTDFIGGFDHRNNKPHGKLATTFIQGDAIIIEYYEPESVCDKGRLSVGSVTHAFKDVFSKSAKAINGYGDNTYTCAININCPEGDEWQTQSQSVVMIIGSGGGGLCSGTLINNTSNDGKPYILTADHCVGSGDGATWVYLFNWESPTCENQYPDIDDQTVSGSTLRARNSASDFALFEMGASPPEDYNAIYSGWDRSGEQPHRFIGISHGAGDIKKWNEESFKESQEIDYWYTSVVSHSGQTIGGSSGCGVWDQNGRLIGQLYGGAGGCDEVNKINYWGRFDKSWEGGGSSSTRLKDWLDPIESNEIIIDFLDPYAPFSELTFQVTLGEIPDLYEGGDVRLIFGDMDSVFVMENMGNDLYTAKVKSKPGTGSYYYYAYQNGSDPVTDFVDEKANLISTDCGDSDGFRSSKFPVTDQPIPAVIYGSCEEESVDISTISLYTATNENSVQVSRNLRMLASVSPNFATNQSVIWSVDDPSIGTIDNTGLLTGVEEGLIVVSATAQDAFGVVGTLELTVEAYVPSKVDVTFQVDINEQTNFYDGGKVWFSYGNWSDWEAMSDPDDEGIYALKVELLIGDDFKYMFGYDTGTSASDYEDERYLLKGSECGDEDGLRSLMIPEQPLILPVVNYGYCEPIISSIRPVDINHFNIYPNPSYGTTIIEFRGNGNGNAKIEIKNMQGRVVYRSEQIGDIKHEFCLEEPAGIYFVTIQTESKTYTKRILLIN